MLPTLCYRVRPVLWFLGGCRPSRSMCTESSDDYFVPPEAVRGCTTLNRSAFYREFELPCVKIARPNLCSSFLKRLSHVRLRCQYIKTVLNITNTAGAKVSPTPSHIPTPSHTPTPSPIFSHPTAPLFCVPVVFLLFLLHMPSSLLSSLSYVYTLDQVFVCECYTSVEEEKRMVSTIRPYLVDCTACEPTGCGVVLAMRKLARVQSV